MDKPKLYYFGRTSLWIFAILLIEGVALSISPSALGWNEAPGSLLSYSRVFKFAVLVLAPLGIVAALGLMHQQNWARHLMSVVLGFGCIGVIIFGISFISEASNAADDAFFMHTSKAGFMIMASIIVLVQAGFVAWSIWHLSRTRFSNMGYRVHSSVDSQPVVADVSAPRKAWRIWSGVSPSMEADTESISTGGIASSVIILIIATLCLLSIPFPALPLFGGGIFLIAWSLYKNRVVGKGLSVALGGMLLTSSIEQLINGGATILLMFSLLFMLAGILLIASGFIKRRQKYAQAEKE